MTETERDDVVSSTSVRYVAGTLGMVVAGLLAVILGVHPPGSTDLYDDGAKFIDHVGPFWIAIHLAASVVLLGLPAVVAAWGDTLRTPAGRVFGRLAGQLSVAGIAIGVIHIAGTDTMSFLAYEDTLRASGREGAALIGADVLLRIHAATLTAWVIGLFLAVPLAAAFATGFDGDRSWRFWLPVANVVLVAASISVTLIEGQWTTLSEMVLFRPAATLFIIWLGLIGYSMRRSAGSRRPAPARPA